MRRKLLLAALCVLALGVAWELWWRRGPVPLSPIPVSAKVLSITNDSTGMRHATFQVDNSAAFPVALLAIYALQNQRGFWRTNQMPDKAEFGSTNLMGVLPFHPQSKMLQPGESYEVTLPLPFDEDRWRASFWYLETQQPSNKQSAQRKNEAGQPIAYTAWRD